MNSVRVQKVKMSSEGCSDEHQEPSPEIHEQMKKMQRFTWHK